MVEALVAAGCSLAASVREAVEFLTADASFDLLLCDVMMPDGSGIDLYDRIGAEWPQLLPRVAFLTGAAFTPRVAEFLSAIDNPRLIKPVNATALNEFVQAVLTRSRARVA